MSHHLAFLFGILAVCVSTASAQSSAVPAKIPSFKAFEYLDIPTLMLKATETRSIKVAVIDDGFNVNHKSLRAYWYRNMKDIANEVDDDGNGYIDDVSGWDVADNDNNTSIPEGREDFFYHGTMIAGVITQVAQRCFGAAAADYVKIIPVKVLHDQAQTANFDQGYAGISYAVRSNADIIVCAWSGGKVDLGAYTAIFEEAKRKGILIFAAAGNFYSEKVEPPGSLGSVFVVAAVDSTGRKLANSNYGRKVDLSAQGEFVYAPHPQKENTYGYNDGTSAAVSLVGGCAAVLKVLKPSAGPSEILGALKSTATPIDSLNVSYVGKLGAGIPNLARAVNYLTVEGAKDALFNSKIPEGQLMIERNSKRTKWEIAPVGAHRGINFSLVGAWKDNKNPLQFFKGDSLIASLLPREFPVSLSLKETPVTFKYAGKHSAEPFGLSYDIIAVDSSTLYCKEIQQLNSAEGSFSDGSAQQDYANRCACKWLITVPKGKRVKLVFDEFDTEAKVDYVHLYEGAQTLQENLLGLFSGPELPPIIVSGSNQVLVWFVSNATNTAPGWHLKFLATDEAPGVTAPINKTN